MVTTFKSIVFDHYLCEQLGLWLTYSPGYPLSLELLHNLVTADQAIIFDDNYQWSWIRDERSQWLRELEEIEKIGKITWVERRFTDFEDNVIYLAQRPDPGRRTLFEDTLSLLWCRRNGIPFRLSSDSLFELPDLEYYDRQMVECWWNAQGKSAPIDVVQPSQAENHVVKWVFQVEVPELELRYRRGSETGFHGPAVDVTPEEFIYIITKVDDVRALRQFADECAEQNISEPEVRAKLKERWDKVAGRLRIADAIFSGVDLLLTPLSSGFPVMKPVEYASNYLIRRHSSWLLSLNAFNARLRGGRIKSPRK